MSYNYLSHLKEVSNQIRTRKKSSIDIVKPILTRKGEGVLYPNTLMAIHGPSGSGKSRLAETLIAALLGPKSGCTQDNLGFHSEADDVVTVLIDTERSIVEQMPLAIQEIQYQVCIDKKKDPANLEYTSLVNISRKSRMEAVREYIEYLQKKHPKKHLVIVLDVLSDTIGNFNDPEESLSSIDYLNALINNHDCTIVCVIHENPGSVKMRGHLGTELGNKSSTILQITNKDNGPADTTIRYMKCRNSKRYAPFYAVFDEKTRTLKEVDYSTVLKAENNIKASTSETAKHLASVGFPTSRKEILDSLKGEFGIGERTAEKRLKELIDNDQIIKIGGKKKLLKKEKDGKEVVYFLVDFAKDEEE